MSQRVSCLVIGCRRTRRDPLPPGHEWICGKHWATTPKHWRRRYFLFRRRGRADLQVKMWIRLRTWAIEKAVGI